MTREEAIKVMNTIIAGVKHNIQLPMTVNDIEDACCMAIEALKEPKQEELTLEKAIDFLTETGWLPNHDRELTEPKQGELGEFFKAFPELDIEPYNTWNCGADMSKLQANGEQVKNELNRVSKELNSEIEYKAKVKELEDAIAKCEKAEKEFKSRTCKFRSPTNCDFCSFHSDCDEHLKEGDEK